MDTKTPEATSDSRRAGRLNCKRLRCELGEVLNISATGMLVYRKGRHALEPGHEAALTLIHVHGQVTVVCRVAWTKKIGFRRRLIGLQFVSVTPQTRAGLTAAAGGSKYGGPV
jgi:PilZ domain